VCVECLIGKQKKPILFKVTEPSSIPYTSHTGQSFCRQSFCMKNRGKVHVSVQSSSMTHCNRRGAAPENRLVGCAGELPAFCRPARPRARTVSRAAANGATLPLRRRSAGETRGQTPSPAPPTLPRAGSARPVSGPALQPPTQRRCSAPSSWPPLLRSGMADRAVGPRTWAPLTRSGYRAQERIRIRAQTDVCF
jgi:hypothetical protein